MKLLPTLGLAALLAAGTLPQLSFANDQEKPATAPQSSPESRSTAQLNAMKKALEEPLVLEPPKAMVGANPAKPTGTEEPADPGLSPEMIDLLVDGVIAKLRAKPEILLDIVLSYEERNRSAQGMIRPEDPSIGPQDAEITLVHFFDPGCAPCRATATAIEQAAAADGKVRVVMKEFPTTPEGVTSSVNALAAKDYFAAHAAVLGGLAPPSATDKESVEKAGAAVARNRAIAQRYRVSVLPTVFAVGDGFATRLEGPLTAIQVAEKLKAIRSKAAAKSRPN